MMREEFDEIEEHYRRAQFCLHKGLVDLCRGGLRTNRLFGVVFLILVGVEFFIGTSRLVHGITPWMAILDYSMGILLLVMGRSIDINNAKTIADLELHTAGMVRYSSRGFDTLRP